MDYWKRYWKVFWAGLKKSARDHVVIGALLAVATVSYQIRYGIITEAQTHGVYWSIAWPYLIFVAALLLWHLVMTPAVMDAAIRGELESSLHREGSLIRKFQDIENGGKPRLSLYVMEPDWTSISSNDYAVFYLNHIGGRCPTHIRLDPLISKSGRLLIRFDTVPFVKDTPRSVPHAVELVGKPGVIHQKDHQTLKRFLLDGSEAQMEYCLPIRMVFMDGDDRREEFYNAEIETNPLRLSIGFASKPR